MCHYYYCVALAVHNTAVCTRRTCGSRFVCHVSMVAAFDTWKKSLPKRTIASWEKDGRGGGATVMATVIVRFVHRFWRLEEWRTEGTKQYTS